MEEEGLVRYVVGGGWQVTVQAQGGRGGCGSDGDRPGDPARRAVAGQPSADPSRAPGKQAGAHAGQIPDPGSRRRSQAGGISGALMIQASVPAGMGLLRTRWRCGTPVLVSGLAPWP